MKLSRLFVLLSLILAVVVVLPITATSVHNNRSSDKSKDDSDGSKNDATYANNGAATDLMIGKASQVTVELAEKTVSKLADELVFVQGLGVSTLSMYNTAKWVAPELALLEDRPDASIALMELYGNLQEELRSSDLADAYYEQLKRISMEEDCSESVETFKKSEALIRKIETIEALMSIDRYLNAFEEAEQLRVIDAFEETASLLYEANSKYFDDSEMNTFFDQYRMRMENGIVIENGK